MTNSQASGAKRRGRPAGSQNAAPHNQKRAIRITVAKDGGERTVDIAKSLRIKPPTVCQIYDRWADWARNQPAYAEARS